MDLLTILVVLIGLVVMGLLIYLLVTGKAIPDGLKLVLLIAVALLIILCLSHAAGCQIGRP